MLVGVSVVVFFVVVILGFLCLDWFGGFMFCFAFFLIIICLFVCLWEDFFTSDEIFTFYSWIHIHMCMCLRIPEPKMWY